MKLKSSVSSIFATKFPSSFGPYCWVVFARIYSNLLNDVNFSCFTFFTRKWTFIRQDTVPPGVDIIESYTLLFAYSHLGMACSVLTVLVSLYFFLTPAFYVASCLGIVIRLASLVSSLAVYHSNFFSLTGRSSLIVVY